MRRQWIALLCLVCGLILGFTCWIDRFVINPDGVSYLDMADQMLKGDVGAFVHPYWSALYPFLLAITRKIFSPSPAGELVVVHLLTYAITLLALAAFTFFLIQWSRALAIDFEGGSIADFRARTGFAYVLFLWAIVGMIGVGPLSPDICVAALVFLIAGLCARLGLASSGWGTAVSLGLALSSGYFAKAPMLPLGIVVLALVAMPYISPAQTSRTPRRSMLAAAGLIFCLVIAPHIFLLSRQEHHLTFGESGRLNYAWLVTREVPVHAGWIDYTPETGTPVHPLRVLRRGPTVLEFKDTVPGTYPLWYNPGLLPRRASRTRRPSETGQIAAQYIESDRIVPARRADPFDLGFGSSVRPCVP